MSRHNRDRRRLARTDAAHPTAGPLQSLPIRSLIRLRPFCDDCFQPMSLLMCQCCGARSWQCSRVPVPPGMVLIPLPPADDFADLAPTTNTPAATTPTAQAVTNTLAS